jgi:transcriptional regulator with XRE-family HTH domain
MASSAAIAFGREVRRRRYAQGLTLDALGAAADLTPGYIGTIEAGQRDCSLSTMEKLAAGLGAPLGELLGTPELPADTLEAARLLSAIPGAVREPIVGALRAIGTITRGR